MVATCLQAVCSSTSRLVHSLWHLVQVVETLLLVVTVGMMVTVTVEMVTPYLPLCESPHLERMTGTRFIWSIGVN